MPDEIEPALSGAVEQAVLVHQPAAEPTLSRAAVERAARLVPLLVRLQEALAPPAAERLAQAPVADALDAVTEIFGAGAFRLGALAAGDYGVELAGPGDEGADGVTAAPDVAAVASVLNQIAGAARRGDAEVAIDPAILAEVHVALPPTAELFLGPTAARAGQRPGSGWLLGLHAPAGASLGRFAHALGAPLTEALGDLAEAERRLAPETETVDVAFTPSPALGDLAAHPKIGGRTLALSRWNAADDLAARDLDLVADPSAPEDLALRTARGELVRPAPLARIRSATAPQGAFRLLAGWSLQRQHAPWALPLGPLAALSFVPRLTLDGFVVAPATWRLPTSTSRAALARWRQDLGVPRLVQVGTGDELLPVDLDATAAPADLAGQERVFEIWPPVGATADRDGRRIEAVVMVVDAPEPDTTRMHVEAAGAARALERVAPPTELGPAQGWRTFKLFGATARRDELLCDAIVPAIRAGLAGREIDRWFFLPYVDGPGRRPHLRLRVHGPGAPAAFEARLSAALGPSRSRGAWATMETSDYFPERGRFRRDELPSLHAIFESDSELCAALLDGGKEDEAFERIVLAARAADALARGLGFDLEARLALALERRRAAEAASALDDEARRAANAAFRTVGRGLREALSAEPAGPFAEHVRRVADAAHALPAGGASRLAPTLLHLGAVRLLGPDPDGERLGYTFWQRTVEGLSRQRGPRRP
jgi:thiopeptide-type bacteriocin biosynthesis protein